MLNFAPANTVSYLITHIHNHILFPSYLAVNLLINCFKQVNYFEHFKRENDGSLDGSQSTGALWRIFTIGKHISRNRSLIAHFTGLHPQ